MPATAQCACGSMHRTRPADRHRLGGEGWPSTRSAALA